MKIDNHKRIIKAVKSRGITFSEYAHLIELLAKETSANRDIVNVLVREEIVKIENKKLVITIHGEKLITAIEKLFKPKKKT